MSLTTLQILPLDSGRRGDSLRLLLYSAFAHRHVPRSAAACLASAVVRSYRTVRFASQNRGICVTNLVLRFYHGCSGLLADLAVLPALQLTQVCGEHCDATNSKRCHEVLDNSHSLEPACRLTFVRGLARYTGVLTLS